MNQFLPNKYDYLFQLLITIILLKRLQFNESLLVSIIFRLNYLLPLTHQIYEINFNAIQMIVKIVDH
ncbi:hypothetical protein GASC598B02_006180 [Gilliamella apicola SCGC AB-598-B02]|nr:hypothetical protein GASC598B02_006180 [Gilliamella apicola SCGC AB-598-B02]